MTKRIIVRKGKRFAKAAPDVDVLSKVGLVYALQNYVTVSRKKFVLNRELNEYQRDSDNYLRFVKANFDALVRSAKSKSKNAQFRRARFVIKFKTRRGISKVFSTEYARNVEDAILFFRVHFRKIENEPLKPDRKSTPWFPVTVYATEFYVSFAQEPTKQERQEVRAQDLKPAVRNLQSQIQFTPSGRKLTPSQKRRIQKVLDDVKQSQRPASVSRVPARRANNTARVRVTGKRRSRRIGKVHAKTPKRVNQAKRKQKGNRGVVRRTRAHRRRKRKAR